MIIMPYVCACMPSVNMVNTQICNTGATLEPHNIKLCMVTNL
jgi:hypothetical protein